MKTDVKMCQTCSKLQIEVLVSWSFFNVETNEIQGVKVKANTHEILFKNPSLIFKGLKNIAKKTRLYKWGINEKFAILIY